MEGASDVVDTSLISSFPIEEVRKKTGEYLLKEGKISAGEFYSMISKDPVRLYGAEDPALYKENLETFRVLIEKKPLIRKTRPKTKMRSLNQQTTKPPTQKMK